MSNVVSAFLSEVAGRFVADVESVELGKESLVRAIGLRAFSL